MCMFLVVRSVGDVVECVVLGCCICIGGGGVGCGLVAVGGGGV